MKQNEKSTYSFCFSLGDEFPELVTIKPSSSRKMFNSTLSIKLLVIHMKVLFNFKVEEHLHMNDHQAATADINGDNSANDLFCDSAHRIMRARHWNPLKVTAKDNHRCNKEVIRQWRCECPARLLPPEIHIKWILDNLSFYGKDNEKLMYMDSFIVAVSYSTVKFSH